MESLPALFEDWPAEWRKRCRALTKAEMLRGADFNSALEIAILACRKEHVIEALVSMSDDASDDLNRIVS